MSKNRTSGATTLGKRPIRTGPAQQPARTGDEYWAPGEAERPGYALIPQLVGRTWVWPKADPAIHGAPAERAGQRAWWDDGSKW